ncbi:30S ribosomal protein S6--L-glutamate ligase [Serratia microhaemolytica]|uniref:30S ribosomal protein S6--L-glutamate ligase n=1 Tax=Serratia microhaemolytica TaxID=2675110 RepID=UPI000FDF1BD0|nr:30S ribosomal protein S6--L-glutamate ligase [Serratia microhaemolytica]
MKLALISRDSGLYSCKSLIHAAELRGHHIEVLDPSRCSLNINTRGLQLYHRADLLPHYDAVIPRIGAMIALYGIAVLRQFELLGSYALNRAEAISRARDKLHALQLLASAGISVPITSFGYALEDTTNLIKLVGGAPVVVKVLEGTQGIGVALADTPSAAASTIDAFHSVNADILVQQYIREANGCDIRCLVIGDQVVAAIERQAKPGEFRSNLHRGGRARQAELSEQERSVAINATAALGLSVAGVDLLRAAQGPLVMEVNASPGLEGIETTTGVDVAGLMIMHIEQQVMLSSR